MIVNGIDLAPFCADERRDPRSALWQPMSFDSCALATSGMILICIEHPDTMPEAAAKLEGLGSIREQKNSVPESEWRPFSKIPEGRMVEVKCERCEGKGQMLEPCPECEGQKEYECPECGEGMVECRECGGLGNTGRRVACEDCGGSGKVTKYSTVEIDGLFFNWKLIRLVRIGCPAIGLQYAIANGDRGKGSLYFRFPGGWGAVMNLTLGEDSRETMLKRLNG